MNTATNPRRKGRIADFHFVKPVNCIDEKGTAPGPAGQAFEPHPAEHEPRWP